MTTADDTEERTATQIAIDAVSADAIRLAARTVSEDDDLHLDTHVGDDACVECRWRSRLMAYADKIQRGDES